MAILLCLSTMAQAEGPAKKDKGVSLYLAGAGILLLAGGGGYAYYQNREADRDMDIYRRSAFTGNTLAYRDRVEERETLTWAGLAGAALGGILLVVAF
ncbi:MAG TPA: hypothetical protein VK465_09505 [Fibrobacteria bacterium]|nr:hypothetical protein [Fibrobacteria bacterium]